MKFFLIIFLIVCCVCHQVDSAPPRRSPPPPPPPPPLPSYTVIQMVMSWPPTYCKTGNPCKAWSEIRKNFGLHGLWPADANGDSVIDCRGTSIPTFSSPDALKAYLSSTPKLVTDLSTYWPSIIQSERAGYPFWQGQWNKHGDQQEILLREIYICLDDRARSYASCPANPDTRGCGIAQKHKDGSKSLLFPQHFKANQVP
ncbi:hypothetical protein Acr_26g0007020 [Actinidia rufa]|uniref:Uncharacterized protein n=1 Tax=Actinidia rufa TaxID=165716 RepID=A0A7J0H314_9ERIC|nr:hypothetical protein Acr_26g0007020 [Actinidia rufa]